MRQTMQDRLAAASGDRKTIHDVPARTDGWPPVPPDPPVIAPPVIPDAPVWIRLSRSLYPTERDSPPDWLIGMKTRWCLFLFASFVAVAFLVALTQADW